MRIDEAIGSRSTERLSLQWRPEGLVLGTWPAELKKQAEATYCTNKGQHILEFAARTPMGWRIWPNVHLAYRFASILQRIYLTCELDLNEYVRGWLGDDFKYVGGHHYGQVRSVLWPWLLEREYADPADESQLDGFLDRLGKREAHLRPSVGLQRTWGRQEATSLAQRGLLAAEVRSAVTEVLNVLDEPLPPGCQAGRGTSGGERGELRLPMAPGLLPIFEA